MKISEIRKTQDFQDLSQRLLQAEYPDVQIVNDSSGDAGIDAYVPSTRTLFAMYCPEIMPAPKEYYQRKIRSDIKKAASLRDSKDYEIEHVVFLTPTPLTEEMYRFVEETAKAAGFKTGTSKAEPYLLDLLLKHEHLRSQFPELILPDIEKKLDAGIKGMSARIDTQGEEVTAKLDTIKDLIVSRDEGAQKLSDRATREYTRRLERAKEQLDQGLFITAKNAFQELVRDLKADAEFNSPALLSRAYTGWAACEWKMENTAEAARLFEESHSYMPDDPARIANLATAQMLRGDTATALKTIERSLAMKPDDPASIRFKANILGQAGQFDEAVALLNENGMQVFAAYFSGNRYGREGRIEDAEKSYREALEGDPGNIEYMDHVAQCVLVSRQQALQHEDSLPWMLPAAVRHDFEEAEQLLTGAIEGYRRQELPRRLLIALWNRSVARLELGDYKGVISDCDEVLRLDPDYGEAYSNKAKAEMRSEDFESAAKSLERYVEKTGGNKRSRLELINCYFLSGEVGKAKPLILEELEGKISEDDIPFVELAVDVFDRDLDYDRAEAIVQRVEREFPGAAVSLMVRSTHLQNTGQPGAEDLLRQALAKSEGWVEQSVTMKLASLLYYEGRYAEALPFYEKVTDDSEKNPLSYHRLVCLANTGRLREALDYAAKLRGDVETDVEISDVEAAIYRILGELRPAAKIYLNLYHKSGGKVAYMVEHGVCLYRLGETENAIRAFDQIKSRVTKTDDLLTLAQGYNTVGQWRTAIELGYKALQQDRDDPDVHRAYISLFFEMRRGGEMPVVEEKYAKAFEDARDNFNKRFPDAEGFKLIDIKENPNFIKEFLQQRDPSAEEAFEEYKNNKLAFTTKAFLRGRRVFDIWLALTSMPDPGLKGSVVTFEELQREREALAKHREAVVDLTALYTLCRIGKLDILGKVFDRIYVSQAALDELINTINDESLYAATGRSFVVMVDGEPVRREVTAEAIKENVRLLEEVKDFIRSHCEPSGLIEPMKESDEPLAEALVPAEANTAIFAMQKGVPLLSEDGLLRKYLLHERGVEGFSTQTLLNYAHSEGFLTKEELFESVLGLLRLQYRYVSVNDELLSYCARKDAYSSGENFPLALAELGRPEAPIRWLVTALGNFIKELWLLSIPDTSKSLLLHEVLAVITKSHDPQAVLRALLLYLYPKMELIPHYYVEVYRQIKLWASVAHPGVRLPGPRV